MERVTRPSEVSVHKSLRPDAVLFIKLQNKVDITVWSFRAQILKMFIFILNPQYTYIAQCILCTPNPDGT